MYRLVRLFRTSIGSKLMMALTGLVLVLFLCVHLFGNLKLFQGQSAVNGYAAWLHGHPLLWVFRGAMLAILLLHVVDGVRLALENRRCAGSRYRVRRTLETTVASRFMLVTGAVVLAFVLFHLLHFAAGVIDPAHTGFRDAAGRNDVYAMVVHAFSQPWLVALYVIGVVLLGVHLRHAIGSVFQTLGFNHESYQALLCGFSWVLVAGLVLGFVSIPLAVLAGAIAVPGVAPG